MARTAKAAAKAAGTTRWRRRKAARPSEIGAAALGCFAERGFAATSLDEVAARAGVTKGTLYLYFRSKEDLLEAVVRQALVPRIAAFEEAVRPSDPAALQLEQFIASWPALAAAPLLGAIPKLIIAEAGNFPDLCRFYLDAVIGRARRLVVGILRRGMRRGEFRRLDPEAAFFIIVAPLLIALLWKQTFERHDTKPLDMTALCKSHIAILRAGLARGEVT